MRLRSLFILAAGCAAGCLAAPAAAQTSPSGAIEGRINDSLHARPLASATVQAVRQGVDAPELRLAITDDRGRFRIDTLAPGRYAVSFSLPLLDSLGLVIPDRLVEVSAGRGTQVELGMPSADTFRAIACPGFAFANGQGAVMGAVSDAATDRPLPNATVVVGWVENSFDRATMRAVQQQRTGSVTADSLGVYRLCGVPSDMLLVLQVQRNGMAGSPVELMVPDSVGLVRRDLSFVAGAAAPPVVAAHDTTRDTTRAPVRLPAETGNASLTGTVTDPEGRPVRDAQVRVMVARAQARTDSLGRYALSGLPAGTQMVEARHIGFAMARASVELRDGRTAEQALHLTKIVTLDSIRVIARRTRYREFEQHRMSNHMGTFLTEEQIARRNPFETSDLLRMTTGFRVQGIGFDAQVVSSRTSLFGGATCPANIVVDGMPGMDINMIHPSEVAAMEIYKGPAGAPIQYESRCGLILVWTKR